MHLTVKRDIFPLSEAFTISRGSRTKARVLTITVEKDGVNGYGECVPYARYEETLDSVTDQVLSLPHHFTRDDLFYHLPAGAARNAVDCALWDLEAKQTGKRVWSLAGLEAPKPKKTAYTLSLDSAENMLAKAKENNARPLLKVKLGTHDDLTRIEAVRAGAPNSDIIIDANEGWTAEIYSDLVPHLLRLGVKLVEQPLPASDDEALREIDRLIPICADESCHDRASLSAITGKYDFINIKLDKAGGLTEALALKKLARASGFQIMVGCMVGSSLAMAPATLVAQDAMFTDLDGPLLLAEDRSTPLVFHDNRVYPPNVELWG